MVFMASACQESAIDPLTGIFPKATEVSVNLSNCDIEKGELTRTFSLAFTGDKLVEFALVGNKYYLPVNTYTAASAASAKNGNYILGKTTIDGRQIVSGSVIVSKSGDPNVYTQSDSYTFDGMLFTEDGTPFKVKWTGTIAFEPDPEPVPLTKVFSAQSNVASGTNSVTVSLGSAGVDATYDPATYSTIYSGDGNFLAIDFYSKDGYLHEGTYKASAEGGVINEGEFGIGWDPGDLWGIGIYFTNWGTCWWTVNNGATSAEKITSGTINVELKGNKYVITWGEESTYPHWAVFTGEIPALTPAEKPAADYSYADVVTDPVDETYAPVAGVKMHSLTLKNSAGEEVAWFDLVLKEGETNYEGDYLCKEYAHEAFTCGNGYDLRPWGMDYVGGSRYMKGDELVLIAPGEWISVFQLDDDLWEVMGDGFDFVFGTGGGGDEPVYGGDETVAPVAEGSTVMKHTVSLYDHDGLVAVFELLLNEGVSDLTGTYECKEYASEAGLVCNGYNFPDWGISGGSYYMKDGVRVDINAGETVTVTPAADGGYTITGSTGYSFTFVYVVG
jgi:hypothetical protein